MADSQAQSRYETLKQDRQAYLDRARDASALTIPSLVPPEGTTGATELETPYQSVGASGVLALAAKCLTTTLPPNEPFFRLDIEEETRRELEQNPEARKEVEKALTVYERTVSKHVESSGIRVGTHEALTHLIVTGNVLVYFDPEGGLRVFPLSNYVIQRDPSGKVMEIITRQSVAWSALPEEVQSVISSEAPEEGTAKGDEETFYLYTHITRTDEKTFEAVQSVNETLIESTRGTYPADMLPYRALRWMRVDGESYGRSHVDMVKGDLNSLEGLTKAIIEFTAMAAKVIPLVNPNGMTDEDDLADAENGEYVPGRAEDVTFVQIQKYADLQVARSVSEELTQRIARHFLVTASIQRAGERVTAQEIRIMAAALEETIGGVYALLAEEFQLPLVRIVLDQLTRAKKLPKLPSGLIEPRVVAGVDALSRAADLVKLDQLMSGLRDLYGPEALAQETKVATYLQLRASALGLDITGLVPTDEEKQAALEQQQQMQMMQNLGPNAINQLGGMAQASMKENPNG